MRLRGEKKMKIYQQKQRWKWWLAACAMCIVIVSLWYSQQIVNKISVEEKEKVKLWADAVQKRARLIETTGDLFVKMKNEERKKNGLEEIVLDPDLPPVLYVYKNIGTVDYVLGESHGARLCYAAVVLCKNAYDTGTKEEKASNLKTCLRKFSFPVDGQWPGPTTKPDGAADSYNRFYVDMETIKEVKQKYFLLEKSAKIRELFVRGRHRSKNTPEERVKGF